MPPRTTAIGALAYYVSHADPRNYQPTNITFGIMEPAPESCSGQAAGTFGEADGSGRAQDRDVGAGVDGPGTMEQLRDFLDYLRLNRNASAHTVAAYDSDLSQFLAFAAQESGKRRALEPKHLNLDLIRGFLGELHRQGQARASVARKVSALRTFVRYLRREGWIDSDPAALAVSPKREQKVPAHLSVDEMSRLLEMPDVSTPLGRRDRAILELFYASGIRLSELVGLDLEDVDLSARARVVRVMGKGGKERIVPFNGTTEKAIRAWLADRLALRVANPKSQIPKPKSQRRPAVRQCPRRTAHRTQRAAACRALCEGLQHAVRHQPARAAALLRDAPAAERRRSPRHPGAARPRAPLDDAALHARQRRAAARGLSEVASPRAEAKRK